RDVREDRIKWLKEYGRVTKFNKWDDMMCLANAYFFLDGAANQWYCRGHLLGTVDERNCQADFIKWCNYIKDMKQKRVGRRKFKRLPNVVLMAAMEDESGLVSLIRRIVQEEAQRMITRTDKPADSYSQSLEKNSSRRS
ncbi:hypothetical protein AVEN_35379-2-1, partial [Araneus ventricosus]